MNTQAHDNIYIDPVSDIFVLYLLGSPENNDILLDFINNVLIDVGFEPVVSVEVTNPFNLRTFVGDKLSILDVKARDEQGRILDIEVQSVTDKVFAHRSLYYWARNYSQQIKDGALYSELKPVICINLLKDKLFTGVDKLHTVFLPFEKDYKELPLTDHLQIHFIELGKYLTGTVPHSSLQNWLEFFTKEGVEENAMKTLVSESEAIRKAHEQYQSFCRSDELREVYEAREKYKKDEATRLHLAEQHGLEQGLEQAARRMIKMGSEIEFIVKATGLSREEIEKLR
jgi:predicted transposase/invertase (TIGR01784 family)